MVTETYGKVQPNGEKEGSCHSILNGDWYLLRLHLCWPSQSQGWAPHFRLLMKPVFWPSWKPGLFAPEKLTWIDSESSCGVTSASHSLAVVQACWLCSIAFFSASRVSQSSLSTFFCLFKTCRLLSSSGWVCWSWDIAEALTVRLLRPSVIFSICTSRSGSVWLILSLSFLFISSMASAVKSEVVLVPEHINRDWNVWISDHSQREKV